MTMREMERCKKLSMQAVCLTLFLLAVFFPRSVHCKIIENGKLNLNSKPLEIQTNFLQNIDKQRRKSMETVKADHANQEQVLEGFDFVHKGQASSGELKSFVSVEKSSSSKATSKDNGHKKNTNLTNEKTEKKSQQKSGKIASNVHVAKGKHQGKTAQTTLESLLQSVFPKNHKKKAKSKSSFQSGKMKPGWVSMYNRFLKKINKQTSNWHGKSHSVSSKRDPGSNRQAPKMYKLNKGQSPQYAAGNSPGFSATGSNQPNTAQTSQSNQQSPQTSGSGPSNAYGNSNGLNMKRDPGSNRQPPKMYKLNKGQSPQYAGGNLPPTGGSQPYTNKIRTFQNKTNPPASEYQLWYQHSNPYNQVIVGENKFVDSKLSESNKEIFKSFRDSNAKSEAPRQKQLPIVKTDESFARNDTSNSTFNSEIDSSINHSRHIVTPTLIATNKSSNHTTRTSPHEANESFEQKLLKKYGKFLNSFYSHVKKLAHNSAFWKQMKHEKFADVGEKRGKFLNVTAVDLVKCKFKFFGKGCIKPIKYKTANGTRKDILFGLDGLFPDGEDNDHAMFSQLEDPAEDVSRPFTPFSRFHPSDNVFSPLFHIRRKSYAQLFINRLIKKMADTRRGTAKNQIMNGQEQEDVDIPFDQIPATRDDISTGDDDGDDDDDGEDHSDEVLVGKLVPLNDGSQGIDQNASPLDAASKSDVHQPGKPQIFVNDDNNDESNKQVERNDASEPNDASSVMNGDENKHMHPGLLTQFSPMPNANEENGNHVDPSALLPFPPMVREDGHLKPAWGNILTHGSPNGGMTHGAPMAGMQMQGDQMQGDQNDGEMNEPEINNGITPDTHEGFQPTFSHPPPIFRKYLSLNRLMHMIGSQLHSFMHHRPMHVRRPILIRRPMVIRRPIVIRKPIVIRRPIVIHRPVEVQRPLVVQRPVVEQHVPVAQPPPPTIPPCVPPQQAQSAVATGDPYASIDTPASSNGVPSTVVCNKCSPGKRDGSCVIDIQETESQAKDILENITQSDSTEPSKDNATLTTPSQLENSNQTANATAFSIENNSNNKTANFTAIDKVLDGIYNPDNTSKNSTNSNTTASATQDTKAKSHLPSEASVRNSSTADDMDVTREGHVSLMKAYLENLITELETKASKENTSLSSDSTKEKESSDLNGGQAIPDDDNKAVMRRIHDFLDKVEKDTQARKKDAGTTNEKVQFVLNKDLDHLDTGNAQAKGNITVQPESANKTKTKGEVELKNDTQSDVSHKGLGDLLHNFAQLKERLLNAIEIRNRQISRVKDSDASKKTTDTSESVYQSIGNPDFSKVLADKEGHLEETHAETNEPLNNGFVTRKELSGTKKDLSTLRKNSSEDAFKEIGETPTTFVNSNSVSTTGEKRNKVIRHKAHTKRHHNRNRKKP